MDGMLLDFLTEAVSALLLYVNLLTTTKPLPQVGRKSQNVEGIAQRAVAIFFDNVLRDRHPHQNSGSETEEEI